MKTIHPLLPCSLLALALAGCSPAPEPAAGSTPEAAEAPAAAAGPAVAAAEGIAVHAPWIRQPPPSAQVAAGYLRIVNPGQAADRLLAVETGAASRVEIHEMEEVDGVMRMREVEGGLEVPAAGQADLEPGGYHLMLVQPRQGLEAGQQVDATLVFEGAGRLDVTFEVRPPGAGAGDHGDHRGHGGHGEHDDHGH